MSQPPKPGCTGLPTEQLHYTLGVFPPAACFPRAIVSLRTPCCSGRSHPRHHCYKPCAASHMVERAVGMDVLAGRRVLWHADSPPKTSTFPTSRMHKLL